MKSSPPEWQAHSSPNYDQEMSKRCATLESDLVVSSTARARVLKDPRLLHEEIFAGFTPPSCPEYAGTYRGTPNTTLAGRTAQCESQLNQNTKFTFVRPEEVERRMAIFLDVVRNTIAAPIKADYDKLLVLAYAFCWFGKIHPFLDGNGHVQRAFFVAVASELGCLLTVRFSIHPRPYGTLMAIALELFSTAQSGTEEAELGAVAEYLAFFLGGSFDASRKNLSPLSLY